MGVKALTAARPALKADEDSLAYHSPGRELAESATALAVSDALDLVLQRLDDLGVIEAISLVKDVDDRSDRRRVIGGYFSEMRSRRLVRDAIQSTARL